MRMSIWLIPEEKAEADFAAEIATANIVRGRTVFRPHLTLATGECLDTAEAALAQMAASFNPLTINRAGLIKDPNSYIQAYALQYEKSPELAALQQQVAGIMNASGAFNPHVSLTYGRVDNAPDFDAAAQRLSSPVTFNRLVAVIVPDKNTTQAHINSWQLQRDIRLGAPS